MAALRLLPASRRLQAHSPPQTPGAGSRGRGGKGCSAEKHLGLLRLSVHALHLTFCRASRSGLPLVNAKMGSLDTFREEACFHRSLDARAGREVAGQQRPPQTQCPPGSLGWPGILKSRATTGLGGEAGLGVQSPSSSPRPAVCLWARELPPLSLFLHQEVRVLTQTHVFGV